MKRYKHLFEVVSSSEALFRAWDRFKKDKRNKEDVLRFEMSLEQSIFALQRSLRGKTYRHDKYVGFRIADPKLLEIHKATVRDRLLHHAVFSVLNPIFEPTFIPTSFSCRVGKGTHKGVRALADMLRTVSYNDTRPCFVLKCDVRRFFDSIDHDILLRILEARINDENFMWLMREIVESFATSRPNLFEREGVPIGNLTSQLFANIYMNEFDQFVKHELRIKDYARYTDDFVIVSGDIPYLRSLIPHIEAFLESRLHLRLHPGKVAIRNYRHGVDFLGYIVLPHCILNRAKTKRRMFRKLRQKVIDHKNGAVTKSRLDASLQSYMGVLSHANAYRLSEDLKNKFWYWTSDKS